MSVEKSPFRMCGCLYAATEDEARALLKVLKALGGGGFSIEHVVTNADGSETRRTVKP